MDGSSYRLIGFPFLHGNPDGDYSFVVFVREDGTITNSYGAHKLSNNSYEKSPVTLGVSNPSAKFEMVKEDKIQVSKGYENYELIYTGRSANGIGLTYREFSADGLARVAFFQSLAYDADAKLITFKKFRIAINQATSSEIKFTVLEDGYNK